MNPEGCAILGVVGLTGSGKTTTCDYLGLQGYQVIRLGKIIIDEVISRGLEVTPENERIVREDLRSKFGMDVCAQKALPALRGFLQNHNIVVIDDLTSLSEYKTLKTEFEDDLFLLALYTPKLLRYERLAKRPLRAFSKHEAEQRDWSEIEKIEKAGPIALADHMLINQGTLGDLHNQIDSLLLAININP